MTTFYLGGKLLSKFSELESNIFKSTNSLKKYLKHVIMSHTPFGWQGAHLPGLQGNWLQKLNSDLDN